MQPDDDFEMPRFSDDPDFWGHVRVVRFLLWLADKLRDEAQTAMAAAMRLDPGR